MSYEFELHSNLHFCLACLTTNQDYHFIAMISFASKKKNLVLQHGALTWRVKELPTANFLHTVSDIEVITSCKDCYSCPSSKVINFAVNHLRFFGILQLVRALECVHMMSRRPCWRGKQRNGGHLGGVKYSFGD